MKYEVLEGGCPDCNHSKDEFWRSGTCPCECHQVVLTPALLMNQMKKLANQPHLEIVRDDQS